MKLNGLMRSILTVLPASLIVIFFWSNPRMHQDFEISAHFERLGSNLSLSQCQNYNDRWRIGSDIMWNSYVVVQSENNACFTIETNQRNFTSFLENDDEILYIVYFEVDQIRKVMATTKIIAAQSQFMDGNIIIPVSIEDVKTLRDPLEELIPNFVPVRRRRTFIMAPNTTEEHLAWNRQALKDVNFILFPRGVVSNKILMQALYYGAIPVFIGAFNLPFAEVLDWNKIAISLSQFNATDVITQLTDIETGTILSMRRQGFQAFRTYFSSLDNIMDALCLIIMKRLALSAPMFKRTESFDLIQGKILSSIQIPSASFDPNEDYFLWNMAFHPWARAPFYPGTHNRDVPKWYKEQHAHESQTKYTPIFMTYKRTNLMCDLLKFLNGTRLIDQVIVVWNDVGNPLPKDFQLPQTYFPVHILRAEQNSLNNRVLPFDIINTEAIFMMDDDTRVSDPLIFDDGFRIWREHQDQMVGISPRTTFPNEKGIFNYHTGADRDFALTLTSATFIHQYFAFAYTYHMPQRIRDEVDQHKNCEDIFMAGLIADFSAKPPVKFSKVIEVTCGQCEKGKSISKQNGHYQRRAECINRLINFYGYMPLISTISYADVL